MSLFTNAVENDVSKGLIAAINSRKINYVDGQFRGDINASISRELKELGGVFDKKTRGWLISKQQMPEDLLNATQKAQDNMQMVLKALNKKLDGAKLNVMDRVNGMDLEHLADVQGSHVTEAFKQTVTEEISVQPDISDAMRIQVDESYIDTKTLPIKKKLKHEMRDNIIKSSGNFAEEEVVKLRQTLEKAIYDGKSRLEIQDIIQARLGVSKSRAKFIARQETALYTSKLKETQYKEAGIEKYVWRATHDNRVRHDHEILDGNEYSWDNPPVVNLKTQARAHPGEDFNCRCEAEPIVEW